MKGEAPILGLQINSPLVTPSTANFRPPYWPPPSDFPVVIDAEGVVISVYGDVAWNLAPWAGKTCSVPFGDGGRRGAAVSGKNADLLRQIAAWWLWGASAIQSAVTLKVRVSQIRQLAAVCSEQGILMSELTRFPKVIDKIATSIRASDGHLMIGLLHRLLAHRDALGFVILDEVGIRRLASRIPDHHRVQTAYIPPRIWAYQLNRLRELLDDYLSLKDKVSACFAYSLEAYRANAGSWEALFDERWSRSSRPFVSAKSATQRAGRLRSYGPFRDTARRFGIDGLLKRWVDDDSISGFSELLNMVREAGLAYVLNFSLMRVDEGAQLRAGCYSIERDALNQDIHMLSSATSKTQQDANACWICSPSVSVAIEAMTHVALLRLGVAERNPHRRFRKHDRTRPWLWSSGTEPWARGNESKGERGNVPDYAAIIGRRSKMFDPEKIRITQADLDVARAMTFGLDPSRFAIGNVWPFAWHQLRRTGVCNMLASGLVSESSLRYQLKHLTVVMTRYYGQNYFRIKSNLNEEAGGFFLKEMYAKVAREVAELAGDQFISPHGEKRKDQILKPITESDHKTLVKAAKAGTVSYRETLLGGCTQATCIYGGVTNIAACMGTADDSRKACQHLIINKDRQSLLTKLIADFDRQLGQTSSTAPMGQSLVRNRDAAKEAIDVINRAEADGNESRRS
ncbi:hypothetical protein JAK50_11460 [Stenotrophomonas maltophilia]|nr:hypothetical protein [Stenotrophomonas maltophilia]